jgi:hypothetical protein
VYPIDAHFLFDDHPKLPYDNHLSETPDAYLFMFPTNPELDFDKEPVIRSTRNYHRWIRILDVHPLQKSDGRNSKRLKNRMHFCMEHGHGAH